MPVTQRKRSFQLFRKLKFSNCSSSSSGDEGQLDIDRMILHALDCLGALQCVMGQYDPARAKVFWGAVATIAEIGIDQAIGHVDKRHPGATHLVRAFPNDLKATDGRGWLPLHWAAVIDNVDVEDVRKIARADPLATVKGCNQPISATPGHLISAVRHPRMEVVHCLYNFHPRMANARDNDGDLPLHYAARYSESTEMIQFLLQANPSATKVRGEGNLVPLQAALFNESEQRVPIVKCLLDADSSAASIINSDGDTLFHLAINQDCGRDLLEHLLTAFPEGVSRQNDVGQCPLHAACYSKDLPRTLELIKMLLKAYPQAAQVSCALGHIPLHIAAENSTPVIVQLLLDTFPGGLVHGCPEDNNNLPVMKAVAAGNEANTRFFCEQYPECLQEVNDFGWNALHFAAEGDNRQIMSWLHKVNPAMIRQQDKEGRLPLHIFVQIHQEILIESSNEADCLRFLLKHYPESVAVGDHNGETGISLSIAENSCMRRLLLRAQPEINPEELKSMNYEHRRMGLFLANCAINKDGIPNIFSRLRGTDVHLLQAALSYL